MTWLDRYLEQPARFYAWIERRLHHRRNVRANARRQLDQFEARR